MGYGRYFHIEVHSCKVRSENVNACNIFTSREREWSDRHFKYCLTKSNEDRSVHNPDLLSPLDKRL